MRTCLAVMTCCAAYCAHAADVYPNKPIRIIITVAPGGGADITARAIGQKLSEAWGQQVVVDNRPGGNGIVGMDIAAHASPDGYTIVEGTIGPVAVNPSLYSKLPYDPVKDFAPIARAVTALNMLVVYPSLPAHSVKELIAYAKANPGKLNYGSSGVGFADHLAGALFETLAGVKMQHVPYKGGAPAMVDLLGGNIQLIFATVSTSLTHVKAGRIRALAVTSAKRVAQFADVPTVAEAGVPGFAVDNWYGFMAPRGTPKPIVEKLNAEMKRIMALSNMGDRLAAIELVTSTPQELDAFIRSETERFGTLIKQLGLKAE